MDVEPLQSIQFHCVSVSEMYATVKCQI